MKRKRDTKDPIVIEFNLSKTIIFFIVIGIIISAITTANVIKTIQQVKMNNNLVNEDVDIVTENINNVAYISINSEIISLQENDNTKLNIRIVYEGEEVLYKDTTTEWVTESQDGGSIEIIEEEDYLYITGKSVGTVTLYAKINYNEEIIQSNSVTIEIKQKLDPYYQKVTFFRYNSPEIYNNTNGWFFGLGKENSIPPEISDLIVQTEEYDDLITQIRENKISKQNAVEKLRELYANISENVAVKDFSIDDNGNISLSDYEEQTKEQEEKGEER